MAFLVELKSLARGIFSLYMFHLVVIESDFLQPCSKLALFSAPACDLPQTLIPRDWWACGAWPMCLGRCVGEVGHGSFLIRVMEEATVESPLSTMFLEDTAIALALATVYACLECCSVLPPGLVCFSPCSFCSWNNCVTT